MRLVTLSPVLIGKKLAKTVYSADGRPLLGVGTVLTDTYLKALQSRGYQSIYIENELLPDLIAPDAINDATRLQATTLVKTAVDRLSQGGKIDLRLINRIVDQIIDEIEGKPDQVFGLSPLRSVEDEAFAHGVNVCVLAVIIGAARRYNRLELHKLGVGALLHDIGKVIAPELPRKPGPLTPEEWVRMRRHTEAGYQILKECDGLSLFSAHAAFQHHERLDGTGYPRGLKQDEIHEFGKVVAVADVFDSMTSDRPYGQRMAPHLVAEYMLSLAGRQFDPKILDTLFTKVERYPTGSLLALNNGQIAVVTGQWPSQPTRPVVERVTDSDQRLMPHHPVALAESPELAIKTVLTEFPLAVREQLQSLYASPNRSEVPS